MSTSYISYQGQGFWAGDTWIELATEYLIQTIKQKVDPVPEWLEEYIRKELHGISKGYFPNYVNFHFEEYLTDVRVNEFVNFLEETLNHLATKGEAISKEEVNSFIEDPDLQPPWEENIPVQEILKIIRGIHSLLTGLELSKREGGFLK